ncbi:MAG: hypothetical protein GX205_07390 [Firmicutes bacterium]|nr:hypothetical protein [Bacillota bacterium]
MQKNSYRGAFLAALIITFVSLGAAAGVLAAGTLSIEGYVDCAESNVPLNHGTVFVDGKEFPIEQGHFRLELPPGQYSLTITGAYREPKTFALEAGQNTDKLYITLGSRFSPEEIDLLARITRAEAEGESHQGQVAVAATVLNRVRSPRYPNTISEVVYQRLSGRYQYSPVADGRINLAATPATYEAAFEALAGADPTYGATGFFNPAKTRDRWVRSHPVTTVIGNHRFFKY